MTIDDKKLKCKACGSKTVYVTGKMIKVCRRCGTREKDGVIIQESPYLTKGGKKNENV